MRRSVRYRCLGGSFIVRDGVELPAAAHADVERAVGAGVGKVRALFDLAAAPIDRVLAARKITPTVLADIVSEGHARNLRRAATNIAPELHERLRELRTPQRDLLALAKLPRDAQRRALERLMYAKMAAVGDPQAPRRRAQLTMSRRDLDRLAALLDRYDDESFLEGLRKLAPGRFHGDPPR